MSCRIQTNFSQLVFHVVIYHLENFLDDLSCVDIGDDFSAQVL